VVSEWWGIGVWWRRVVGGESAPGGHFGQIAAYRGCVATGSPIDVVGDSNATSGESAPVAPSITTLTANTLVLFAAAAAADVSDYADVGYAAIDPASGPALTRAFAAGEAVNSGEEGAYANAVGLWHGVNATPGATGSETSGVTASTSDGPMAWGAIMLALKPA
jgi:hypothetical protein